MEGIKQRVRTLVQAVTLRQVIALPIFVAFVSFAPRVISAIGQLPETQFLGGVPPWAWSLIAGLALMLYFVFEAANRLRVQLEPKLAPSFNPQAEGIVRTPTEVYERGVKTRDDEAAYVRLTLTTLRRMTARNCSVFITGIAKMRPTDQAFIDIPIYGSLALLPHPIDVHPLVPVTVDFLKAGRDENILDAAFSLPFRLRGIFNDIANYKFTFTINAGGVSQTYQAEVDWNGHWDEIGGRGLHGTSVA